MQEPTIPRVIWKTITEAAASATRDYLSSKSLVIGVVAAASYAIFTIAGSI